VKNDHDDSPPETGSVAPILEVDELSVTFGGIKAVDRVSFRMEAGGIYGLLGPNGSGKSTLLAAMTRLVAISHGTMRLRGEDYTSSPRSSLARRGIARTFQTVRLVDDLTVRENVESGADLHAARGEGHMPAAERAALVDDLLEQSGLTNAAGAKPSELSYGAQRRVEIARALAMKPSLLLLDEPTAGMNSTERADIAALMRSLRTQGLTQLLVEHDVAMLVDTCDHLFAMNTGQLIAEGEPRDVVQHNVVQESYLGVSGVKHA
jgi:branched-chain amino acid transport system ATP-binding protein